MFLDPAVTALSGTSANILKVGNEVHIETKFTVQNVASGPTSKGNDIERSQEENYKILLKLSDVDLGAGNPDGLSSSRPRIATVSDDLRQGLVASSGSFDATAHASFDLSAVDCPNVE